MEQKQSPNIPQWSDQKIENPDSPKTLAIGYIIATLIFVAPCLTVAGYEVIYIWFAAPLFAILTAIFFTYLKKKESLGTIGQAGVFTIVTHIWLMRLNYPLRGDSSGYYWLNSYLPKDLEISSLIFTSNPFLWPFRLTVISFVLVILFLLYFASNRRNLPNLFNSLILTIPLILLAFHIYAVLNP